MYPFADRDAAVNLVGSRFLILNGAADPMAPRTSVNTLMTALRQNGAAVEQVMRARTRHRPDRPGLGKSLADKGPRRIASMPRPGHRPGGFSTGVHGDDRQAPARVVQGLDRRRTPRSAQRP